jgi:hypothetical protein
VAIVAEIKYLKCWTVKVKKLSLVMLMVWSLFLCVAIPAIAENSPDDIRLILQQMHCFKDVRFLVTPTLYDRFSADDLKTFAKRQVVRLEVPFDLAPRATPLFWRTAFLLDSDKKMTLQYLKNVFDYQKEFARRLQPNKEWKNAKGETVAYFYPIRNVDVHHQRRFWAIYDTLKNPDRLDEKLTAWFRPELEGEYQFFIEGDPKGVWLKGKELKDGDKMILAVNDYPFMIESQMPYDPKSTQKQEWPKVKVTFKDPSGKTRELDESCIVSGGIYSGVVGEYYATAKPNGKPLGHRQDYILDVTSQGDLWKNGPVLSAKWHGEIGVDKEGSMVVRIETKDHARLWIDEKEVLNAPLRPEAHLSLKSGDHKFLLVYTRKTGATEPPDLHLLTRSENSKDFYLFTMSKISWHYDAR